MEVLIKRLNQKTLVLEIKKKLNQKCKHKFEKKLISYRVKT